MYLARSETSAALLASASTVSSESHGTRILGATGTLVALSIVVVSVRMFVKTTMLKNIGLDDYIMVVALALSIGVFVCFVEEVKRGTGHHLAYIFNPLDPTTFDNFIDLFHWELFHSLMNITGVSLVKISVGIFLLRLVDGRRYRYFVYGMIGFIVAYTLVGILTVIFRCTPIRAEWDFRLLPPFGTTVCNYSIQNFVNLAWLNAALNMFTDIFFATLPIPLIWPLPINLRTKIMVMGILGLGFFACAAGIARMVLLGRYFKDTDATFDNTYVIWTYIEFNLGILAASLPSFRPLFASFLGSSQTPAANNLNSEASDFYFSTQMESTVGESEDGNTATNMAERFPETREVGSMRVPG